MGLGCGIMRPIGINAVEPGVNGTGLQYAEVSQSSPLFFFFIQKKF